MIAVFSRADKLLIFSLTALLMLGVVMIYSSSNFYAAERFGDEFYFLKRHILFLLIALPCALFFLRLKPEKLQLAAIPLAAISLMLLFILLISSHGVTVSGATRWLRLGAFSVQPAELAKFAMVLLLAKFIARREDKIQTFKKGYLPIALIACLFIMPTLLQPDFGTAVFLALLTGVLLFVAGARLRYLLITFLVSLPPIYLLIFSTPYRRRRMLAFLDPWADPQNSGFQIIQSFIAFQQGGVVGQGLGDSRQKLFFLPEAHTDFIFSVIGEEIGFLGVLMTLFLFSIFLVRGIRLALNCKGPFLSYLAFGLTAAIALQALINMGVATGCLPTKGLTLPFLSYGGSSLLVTVIMGAILIKISAQLNRPQRVRKEESG